MTYPSQKRNKSIISMSQPSSRTQPASTLNPNNVKKNVFISQPSSLTEGI